MSGLRPDQQNTGRHFVTDLWRLVQLFVALWLLYSLAVHTLWLASQVVSGQAKALGAGGLAAAGPVAGAIGIKIPLPGPLAELIITCIVVGVITYVVLKWLCQSQWVQQPVNVRKCWEEVQWWNPFSWFVAIVCTVVQVLKWVLQQICSWVAVLVTILVIICIVISIIVVVA